MSNPPKHMFYPLCREIFTDTHRRIWQPRAIIPGSNAMITNLALGLWNDVHPVTISYLPSFKDTT